MTVFHITKVQLAKLWSDPMIFLFIFIQPIIFTFLFGFLFSVENNNLTLSILIGVGEMSIWQVFLYSGGVIVRHEFNKDKTIPLILVSQFNQYIIWVVRLSVCLLAAIPSLIISLVIGVSYFKIQITLNEFWLTSFGVLVFLVSLFSLGLPLILLLFLNPHGGKVIQSISYPIFLLSGMIISTDQLPLPFAIFSRIFPITWSTELIRDTLQKNNIDIIQLFVILLISTIYLILSYYLYIYVIRKIKKTGEVVI